MFKKIILSTVLASYMFAGIQTGLKKETEIELNKMNVNELVIEIVAQMSGKLPMQLDAITSLDSVIQSGENKVTYIEKVNTKIEPKLALILSRSETKEKFFNTLYENEKKNTCYDSVNEYLMNRGIVFEFRYVDVQNNSVLKTFVLEQGDCKR